MVTELGGVRLAVVGCGRWGTNLVRVLHRTSGAKLVAVCDIDGGRLKAMRALVGAMDTAREAGVLFKRPDLDGVVIATPASTHFPLARAALEHGKHVLVEKPMVLSIGNAETLLLLAEKSGKILMVDHTYVYTSAARRIRELISVRALGTLRRYVSLRANPPPLTQDVGVAWDLAPHDIAILDYVLPGRPVSVSAIASSRLGAVEDSAEIRMGWGDGFTAWIGVNWLSRNKIRRVMIAGTKGTLSYNYSEMAGHTVRVSGVASITAAELLGNGSDGAHGQDPRERETLRTVIEEFIGAIEHRRAPIADGHAGLRVVEALVAAHRSMAKRGKEVRLDAAC